LRPSPDLARAIRKACPTSKFVRVGRPSSKERKPITNAYALGDKTFAAEFRIKPAIFFSLAVLCDAFLPRGVARADTKRRARFIC
jgi:hypothetical protein